MYNTLLMNIVNRAKNWLHNGWCLLIAQPHFILQKGLQAASRYEIHGHVQLAFKLDKVLDFHDVWVVKIVQDFSFLHGQSEHFIRVKTALDNLK